MKCEVRINTIAIALVMAGVATFACSAEDEPNRAFDREARLQAESEAEDALDDYAACFSESPEDCAIEEEGLINGMEELDLMDGELQFRGKAIADCGGGVSVTCSGTGCVAVDGMGCGCINGDKVDVKLCDIAAA